MSYIPRVMTLFAGVSLSILYLGYAFLLTETHNMVLFDKTSIGIFVCGGAFTYLVSFTILSSIERSTD